MSKHMIGMVFMERLDERHWWDSGDAYVIVDVLPSGHLLTAPLDPDGTIPTNPEDRLYQYGHELIHADRLVNDPEDRRCIWLGTRDQFDAWCNAPEPSGSYAHAKKAIELSEAV